LDLKSQYSGQPINQSTNQSISGEWVLIIIYIWQCLSNKCISSLFTDDNASHCVQHRMWYLPIEAFSMYSICGYRIPNIEGKQASHTSNATLLFGMCTARLLIMKLQSQYLQIMRSNLGRKTNYISSYSFTAGIAVSDMYTYWFNIHITYFHCQTTSKSRMTVCWSSGYLYS
jgi:hypothetical protein